jgi:hypothetical protein
MNFLKRLAAALKSACRTLSPDCREASRLQSEALDHSLSAPRRAGLRMHLLLCRWCRRYGKQVRFLRQAVREHPDEVNEGQTLSPEARERLKQSLRDRAG